MNFIFFVLFILLLYSVSIRLTSSIYGLTFLVSRSQRLALGILSLILLPGTIIHEMSHFLAATMLRVPTGKMSIFPEALEQGKVRAGKLEISDCDPFRKTIIGIAPMLVGLTLIYFIGEFFFSSFSLTTNHQQLTAIIGFYFLLTVSATMFSSPKDLESLIIVLPILTILFLFFYFIGLRITLTGNIIDVIENLVKKLNFALIISIVANFLIVIICTFFIQLFQKILKRNLIER